MSNTVPKLSIFFSTAPPDLGRFGRPRLGLLRSILAFSALAIAALSASGQNITSTVNTDNEAVAIDVISSQNTIYVTTGDNTLTAINGATNAVTVFNDPAAANTSGASAMVTYFNGVLFSIKIQTTSLPILRSSLAPPIRNRFSRFSANRTPISRSPSFSIP